MSDVIDQRFGRFDDRIGRLEEDVKEIKGDPKAFRQRMAGSGKRLRALAGAVEQRSARLEGVAANLPSTRVMLTAIAASQVTLLGFTFLILRCAPKWGVHLSMVPPV